MSQRAEAASTAGRALNARQLLSAHRVAALATIIALFTVSLGFVVLAKPIGGQRFVAVMDIAPLLAELSAVALVAWASWRGTRRARLAWGVLATGLATYAVGDVIWTWYDVVSKTDVPTPSWADAFYLGSIPLILAGIALLSSAGRTLNNLRTRLDAGLVLFALTILGWGEFIRPMLDGADTGTLGTLVTVAYPAADVLFVFSVFVALRRQWHGQARVVLYTFAAGLLLSSLSDLSFAELVLHDGYATGSIVDIGWPVGFLLMGLAATMQTTWSVRLASENREAAGSVWTNIPPMISVVSVMVWILVHGVSLSDDPTEVALCLAMVALAVIRQAVARRDSVLLTREVQTARDELDNRVRERTAALMATEFRFAALAANSSDMVTVVDAHSIALYQSPSSMRILGYEASELLGTAVNELVHPSDRFSIRGLIDRFGDGAEHQVVEARVKHKDGSWRWLEFAWSDHRDEPAIGGFVLNARDITERRRLEAQLQHETLHDGLTGLANRVLFADRLQQAIARSKVRGTVVAVLFLDVDDFKSVNDTIGHAAGDSFLQAMAARLLGAAGPGNTAARFGGDEFVVLLEDGQDREWAIGAAAAVRTRVTRPLELDGRHVQPRVSMGVAIGDADTAEGEELIRQADLAMYVAKSRGKDCVETYDTVLHESLTNRLELLDDLHRAVENGELRLRFQPMWDLRSNEMDGVEALMRWDHPKRGVLRPDEFIPLAEESGVITSLGRWVLQQACATLRDWQIAFPDRINLKMNVNVSPKQLFDSGFVSLVKNVLATTGIDPHVLVLEITESAVMKDAASAALILHEIAALGVQLAIDDFGTGYSSLSYVRDFPFHILKIDKSFISGAAAAGDGAALVNSIVQMSRALHMQTVAEGIEQTDQLHALESLGCDIGQGYLLGRPLTLAQMATLLADPPAFLRNAA